MELQKNNSSRLDISKSDRWWNDRFHNLIIKIKKPLETLVNPYKVQILYLSSSKYIMKKLDEPTPEDCSENKLIIELDFDHESYEEIHKYMFGFDVNFKEENTLNYYQISSILQLETLEKNFRKQIFCEKYLSDEKWFDIYLMTLKLNNDHKNIIREELLRFIINKEFNPFFCLKKDQYLKLKEEDFIYFLEIKPYDESVSAQNKAFQNKIKIINIYCNAFNKNEDFIKNILETIINLKKITDIYCLNYLEKELSIKILGEDRKIELLMHLNAELTIENETLKTSLNDMNYKMKELTEKYISTFDECVILREKLTEFISKNSIEKRADIDISINERLKKSTYNELEFLSQNNMISSISSSKYAYFVFDYFMKNLETYSVKYRLVSGFEKWAFFGIGMKNRIKNGIWETGSQPGLYGITQHGYSKFHSQQPKYTTSNSYFLNKNIILKSGLYLEMKYNGSSSFMINIYDNNSNLVGSEDFKVQIQDSEQWCPLIIFYYEGQKVEVIEFKVNM